MDWRDKAACAAPGIDPGLFFSPDSGERGRPRARCADDAREAAALAVCASCPVMEQCRAWAIQTGERHGVWGGLTEGELEARVDLKERCASLKASLQTFPNGRKTECKYGHPFDKENTRLNPNGSRSCRACRRRIEAARQKQRSAA